ncbi:MAG: glycosyl transferase family 11 [Candidatus Nomurabacteria bacterium]|nr:glycosyl transferase family 11 [Candidatus Nomurabacteria bacterium]
MIIIKLQGGLGNQLFQYSFGRFLEIKLNKEVAYDVSFFTQKHKYTKREYVLDKFNTKIKVATPEEITKVKYPFGKLSEFAYLFRKALNKFFIKKYHIGYDEKLVSFLKEKDSVYLEGWWQSYLFYNQILDYIQDEITLKVPSAELLTLQSEVTTKESVFVHIRRGDYVDGKELETLSMEYYKKAILLIQEKVPNPYFYIFSDDKEWIKAHGADILGTSSCETPILPYDFEEMVLMSHCKHGIIANSSFSYWGAMLNKSNDKVIIAPQDWKNVFMKDNNTLCPPDWIAL